MIDQNELIGFIAAVCTTFAFLPQVIKGLEDQTDKGFVIANVYDHVYWYMPLVCLWVENQQLVDYSCQHRNGRFSLYNFGIYF